MVQAWRIIHEDFLSGAFGGEGARLVGGRWNSEGTPVVYTAGTLSLALLEIIVHLEIKKALQYFKAMPVSFNNELIEHVRVENLPPSWSDLPAGFSAKAIGDQWVQNNRSPVLCVPSAVVPNEVNYLLNPRHPGFSGIGIGNPIDLPVDPRVIEKLK